MVEVFLTLTLSPSLSLLSKVFEDLQMQSDEERDLHTLLSGPHMQKLLSVHDIVRSRSYETPVPQFDPTWHPQTTYDRHIKRGRGKTPEYRTVGLHKSANEPLVSRTNKQTNTQVDNIETDAMSIHIHTHYKAP